jgi:hypothetical protein
MAKFVAPGRLMIKDDNLDLQNPKSKFFFHYYVAYQ